MRREMSTWNHNANCLFLQKSHSKWLMYCILSFKYRDQERQKWVVTGGRLSDLKSGKENCFPFVIDTKMVFPLRKEKWPIKSMIFSFSFHFCLFSLQKNPITKQSSFFWRRRPITSSFQMQSCVLLPWHNKNYRLLHFFHFFFYHSFIPLFPEIDEQNGKRSWQNIVKWRLLFDVFFISISHHMESSPVFVTVQKVSWDVLLLFRQMTLTTPIPSVEPNTRNGRNKQLENVLIIDSFFQMKQKWEVKQKRMMKKDNEREWW